MTDRVAQAVLFGSVELALKQSFINVDDVLEWLAKQAVTQEVTIAYNAVCRRQAPDTQYLKDGVHILAKNPGLAVVAVMHKLDPSIKDRKEGESKELWNYMFESIMRARNDNNSKGKGLIMLTGTGSNDFLRNNLELLYGCRFWREVQGVSTDTTNAALLKTDWIEHLRSNGTVANALLKRVHFLQQHAPQYYGEVAYKQYYAKASALHKEGLLTNLTQNDLVLFNTYFTNIVDTRLLTYDSLCYNIASLTPDVAGYVLGFPIHWFVPNAEQIHEALAILKDKGINEYCTYVKTQTVASVLPTGPHVTEDVAFSNNEDVYGEDIANYVPFDIIAFRNAKHIYRFTRPEFSNLVKSKKNHWTNEWLPASILSTIKSRLETASALGLPDSRTLKEHLNHVKNHNFFEPTVESFNVPLGGRTAPLPTRVSHTVDNSPLNMRYETDEMEVDVAREFYERLREMFGTTVNPITGPAPGNVFTRSLPIHDEEDNEDEDEDEDDEDDHVPNLVDVSMINRVQSPFSPDQDGSRRIFLAHNPRMERPTTFDVPNTVRQGVAVNIRAPMVEPINNPQVSDITRRTVQSNSNPEQLFRLIFETMVEEDELNEIEGVD